MSGGSKSGNSTTGTQITQPWGPQGDEYKRVFGEARGLYDSGVGNQPWTGTRYIAPSSQEMQGLGQIEGLAKQGNPLMGDLLNTSRSLINNFGLNSSQRENMGGISDVANGNTTISTGEDYRNIARQMGDRTNSQEYVQQTANGSDRINTDRNYESALRGLRPAVSENLLATARGENIGANNELLMQNLGRAAGEATDNTSSLFSAGGRYGGGAHQGTVARETGDLYSRGLMAQMNTDLDRQMGAAGQIDQARAGLYGQELAGLAGLTGVQQQNLSNRMNAAAQLDQAEMARTGARMSALQGQSQTEAANIANQVGAGMNLQDIFHRGNQQALGWGTIAPQINEMRYSDAGKMIDVGAAYRGELQNENQSMIDAWDQAQSAPWDRLSRYGGAIGGPGSLGGTQTTTTPKGSAASGLFGGALAGGGMMANSGSPWAMGLGALGGGLFGAMQ